MSQQAAPRHLPSRRSAGAPLSRVSIEKAAANGRPRDRSACRRPLQKSSSHGGQAVITSEAPQGLGGYVAVRPWHCSHGCESQLRLIEPDALRFLHETGVPSCRSALPPVRILLRA